VGINTEFNSTLLAVHIGVSHDPENAVVGE